MSELIAVDGCTIDHGALSPISGGTFTIIPPSIPDLKAKCENKGIYVTPLSYTFVGGDATGFVDGSVAGAGTIPATAVKTKVGLVLVMREGDSGTLNAVGVPEVTPPPTAPIAGLVEITVAGQTTVKAE